MQSDGSYTWPRDEEPAVDSQAKFLAAPLTSEPPRKKTWI
jgi:hypothetical protein